MPFTYWSNSLVKLLTALEFVTRGTYCVLVFTVSSIEAMVLFTDPSTISLFASSPLSSIKKALMISADTFKANIAVRTRYIKLIISCLGSLGIDMLYLFLSNLIFIGYGRVEFIALRQ